MLLHLLRSRAISIAGKYIAWNLEVRWKTDAGIGTVQSAHRTISFPITCKSGGHVEVVPFVVVGEGYPITER